MAFLRDRRRPMFEGQWGCSARCLEAMAANAIRREATEADIAGHDGSHRHRVPLGLILLAQGWITNPQLQHALNQQRQAGTGRIGRWLIDDCGLDQDCITRGLGMQWGCPVLPMEGFEPAAMALAAPKILLEHVGMVPLRVARKRTLYLGFESRLDASAAFAMKRMSGLEVESGVVEGARLEQARRRLSQCEGVPASFEQFPDVESLSGNVAQTVSSIQPRASRLVRIHQFYWLRMWLETGSMSSREGGFPVTKGEVADRVYLVGRQQ